jgi:hypothetical protein
LLSHNDGNVLSVVSDPRLYNEDPRSAEIEDKAKPDVENIKGLNLAVVKLTTVQVTKLPL